jgi:hypothetical protein
MGGGGGGSFNSGLFQVNTSGDHSGSGTILIEESSATTVLISGLGTGATFPVGTSTETYEVTGGGGATATCSFDVIVTDDELPVVTCPADTGVCGTTMSGIDPSMTDNCPGPLVLDYVLSGATTGSGTGTLDGEVFAVGTTTVDITVSDASGNISTCTFDVDVLAGPNPTIGAFDPDSVCAGGNPITIPTGSPAGGTYSGTGVSGTQFDPATAGVFTVYYTVTDTDGCTDSIGTDITVLDCSAIGENELAGVSILPNPSNGVFNIVYNNSNLEKVNILIRDMAGKVIYKSSFDQQQINETITIDKANGVYILEFKAGDKSNLYKLIKQ